MMRNQEVPVVLELVYLKDLHPDPTVTATCRPRDLGCSKSLKGRSMSLGERMASSSESNMSAIDTLPEEIPDELGHEWRVLHPFDLPGVRFPTDSTPPNQREIS